jgi:hypothetical protein
LLGGIETAATKAIILVALTIWRLHMTHKFLATTVFAALIVAIPTTSLAAGDHAVKGRVTKQGTYVAPTRATNPNPTQRDNYGSKPNINPATGKQGTRTPKK